MNIEPLGNRVIVQPVKGEEKTAGGLLLPESAKEKENQGKIVAVAKGIPELKAGDTILYAQYGGTEITVDNTDYVIVELKDVLAVVR